MTRAAHRLALAAAAAAALAGCAATAPREHDEASRSNPASLLEPAPAQSSTADAGARELRSSAQCGDGSETRVRWISGRDEYRAYLLRLGGGAEAQSRVDFDTHGVLVVELGRRPTAGYGIELASGEVQARDGTGTVRVKFTEPPEDAMVAQVITHPCVLVAVRKEGLRSIEVVDQAGRVRGKVDLPPAGGAG